MLTFHFISGENNHNVSLIEQTDPSTVVAELLIGGVTLRLFNSANEKLVQKRHRFDGAFVTL